MSELAKQMWQKAQGSTDAPFWFHAADKVDALERELAEAHQVEAASSEQRNSLDARCAELEAENARLTSAISDVTNAIDAAAKDRGLLENFSTPVSKVEGLRELAQSYREDYEESCHALKRAYDEERRLRAYAVKMREALDAALSSYHDEVLDGMPGGVYSVLWPDWYDEAHAFLRSNPAVTVIPGTQPAELATTPGTSGEPKHGGGTTCHEIRQVDQRTAASSGYPDNVGHSTRKSEESKHGAASTPSPQVCNVPPNVAAAMEAIDNSYGRTVRAGGPKSYVMGNMPAHHLGTVLDYVRSLLVACTKQEGGDA